MKPDYSLIENIAQDVRNIYRKISDMPDREIIIKIPLSVGIEIAKFLHRIKRLFDKAVKEAENE